MGKQLLCDSNAEIRDEACICRSGIARDEIKRLESKNLKVLAGCGRSA